MSSKDSFRLKRLVCACLAVLLLMATQATADIFEDFSNPGIDTSKWVQPALTRMVKDGVLVAELQWSGSNRRYHTSLVNPDPVMTFSSEVMVTSVDFSGPVGSRGAHVRVGGNYYNVNPSPADRIGDLYASINIGDRGNGLEAWYEIYRCDTADATSWSPVASSGTQIVAGLMLDTRYRLTTHYNGASGFTFTILDATDTQIGSANVTLTGDDAREDAAVIPFRGLTMGVYAADPGAYGHIRAEWDNVEALPLFIEDFSAPRMDPTRWNGYESALGPNADGKLDLAAQGNGTRTDSFLFMDFASVPVPDFVETTVSLNSESYAGTGNRVRARLDGIFYNTIGDYAADGRFFAQVVLQLRADGSTSTYCWGGALNSDGTWDPTTEFIHHFPMAIYLDREYAISIEIDRPAGEMNFYIVDTETLQIETYTHTIAHAVLYAENEYRTLRARVDAEGTDPTGFVSATFDNVLTEPRGQITGSVTSSPSTGQIYVALLDAVYANNLDDAEPVVITPLDPSGNYLLYAPTGDWIVGAFQDTNGNGEYEDGEPRGVYTGVDPHNPAILTVTPEGTISDIDFSLYFWPDIGQIYLGRVKFPDTAQPGVPSGEVLQVEAEVDYAGSDGPPVVSVVGGDPSVIVDETGGNNELNDAGIWPDETAGDNIYTGWVPVQHNVPNEIPSGPYVVLAEVGSVIEGRQNEWIPSGSQEAPAAIGPVGYLIGQDQPFTWTAVGSPQIGETVYYNLYMWTDDITNPVLEVEDVAGSNYIVSAAEYTFVEGQTYHWTVIAKSGMALYDNEFHSLALSDFETFTFDTTAAGMPSIDPVASPTNIGTQTITGTKPTDTSIHLADGTEIVARSSDTTWSYDVTLTVGTNIIEVYAEDAAGLPSGTVQAEILYDITPPATPGVNSVTSPTATAAQVISGTKEAGSAIYRVGGATPLVAADASTTWSYTQNLNEGVNTIALVAEDAAGNRSLSPATFTIELDTIAPAAPGINPVITPTADPLQIITGVKESGTNIFLSDGTPIQALPGDTTWGYQVTLTEGTNNFAFYVMDGAGNRSPNASVSIELDTTAPAVPVINPVTSPTNMTPQTISGTRDADAAIYLSGGTLIAAADGSTSWTHDAPLAEGDNVIGVYAQDALGNQSPSAQVTVVLDTNPPASPHVNILPALINDATPTITGTRRLGEAVSVYLSLIDGVVQTPPLLVGALDAPYTAWSYTPAAAMADGPHTLDFIAMDEAGNVSSTSGIAFTIDATAPAGSEHDPANGAVNQALNRTISVRITDAGSGIDTTTITMTVNDTVYTVPTPELVLAGLPDDMRVTYTPATIYDPETTVSWSVTANDMAGNTLPATTRTFVTGANVAVAPTDAGIATDGTVTLTASGGSLPYSWASDGLRITPSGDGLTCEVLAPAVAGAHTVTVTDAAGGNSTANITVIQAIAISGPGTLLSDTGGAFTATGGTTNGDVIWSASAGSIDPVSGAFVAPTVTGAPLDVTITAHDVVFNAGHVTPVVTTAVVTVYPVLDISNAPETAPIVQPGESCSTEFAAAGGDGSYTWTVTGPDGVQAPPVSGATFVFTARDSGVFAGAYTITLSDGLGYETEYTVYVPMVISQLTNSVMADGMQTMIFTVHGAPAGTTFTAAILDESGADVTTDTSVYGSVDGGDGNSPDENFVYTPGDSVTETTIFRLALTVPDWVGTGIETVTSNNCWVVPVIDLSGTVVNSEDNMPIDGVTITPLNATVPTVVTAPDGTFTISRLPVDGTVYSFFFMTTGYMDKVITQEQILADPVIALDAIDPADGVIAGTVSFRDDPGYFIGTQARVLVQKADGEVVSDSTGQAIEIIPDLLNGQYTFYVPSEEMGFGPYTVTIDAEGYVDAAIEGVIVDLTGPANVDATLNPITRISNSAASLDLIDPVGEDDTVEVTITAQAGFLGVAFDGTAGEIRVEDETGDVTTDLTFAGNAYTYTRNAYEAFTITIHADVGEDRDVESGYAAVLEYTYVPTATDPEETTVGTAGGFSNNVASSSGYTEVLMPPGCVSTNAGSNVTLVIAEAGGQSGIVGSGISSIELLDANGNPVPDADIDQLFITMSFDTSMIQFDEFRAVPGFGIFYADTMADLVAGSYAGQIPMSDIVDINYDTGKITFRVSHLTAFGVGTTSPSGSGGGGGGGGGGCFIGSASQTTGHPVWLLMVLILVAMTSGAVVRKKK